MTRRVAFRQCDVERAIRALKAAVGRGRIIIRKDGTIEIELDAREHQQRLDRTGIVL